MYADDLKLNAAINSTNDCYQLQEHLVKVSS